LRQHTREPTRLQAHELCSIVQGMWRCILIFSLPAFVIGVLLGWTLTSYYSSDIARHGVATTIRDLRSAPDRYAGKTVEVAGQLDECSGWECSLCPEEMTSKDRDQKQCLALEFRPLMPGTGFGSEEQEGVFRFSNVVLRAKFDPSCWKGRCTDRQTVLEDAQVVSVGKRRASGSGLWLGDTTGLTDITEPNASGLKSAAYASGFPKGPPIKAFGIQGAEGAVVCWSPAVTEPEWPVTVEGALYARSKSDFFQGTKFQKMADHWMSQVGF
jgi:hypothetical protein